MSEPKRWVTGDRTEGAQVERALAASSRKLEDMDHQYFARKIPRRDHWRAFPEFRDSLVYLDIET